MAVKPEALYFTEDDDAKRAPYEMAIIEFEGATSPITVTVGSYAWWIEPTDEALS